VWAPNELGFARAYVSGDLEVEGDLVAGLEELDRVADPERGPGVTIDAAMRNAIVKTAVRLRVIGLPPSPPPEEVKLRGHRHGRRRDVSAISHHYDVGNDFYRLVLGESMTYSCAYWAQESSAGFGLDDAQYAKCDLVARKLGLADGTRLLDVGCGWGTLAVHAARAYGARVVGVTLSQQQAAFARKRVADEGVADQVEIRVQDYRDIGDGPYDAIASIGLADRTRRCGHAAGLCDPVVRVAASQRPAAQSRHLTPAGTGA
jgi:cyclopropane-fatty-acyl-phospholipid synthase